MGLYLRNIPSSKWKVVYETTLAAAVNTITISGLSIASDKVYKFFLNIHNPVASTEYCRLFFNGDTTTTNYYSQSSKGNGGALTTTRLNEADIGYMEASSCSVKEGTIWRDADGFGKAVVIDAAANGSAVMSGSYAYSTKADLGADMTSITFGNHVADTMYGIGTHLVLCKLC